MLDVQQIFGRAGRPQFQQSGQGIIITQHANLAHYTGMLTHQSPIESQFVGGLVDNLNAEIVLGAYHQMLHVLLDVCQEASMRMPIWRTTRACSPTRGPSSPNS